MLSLVAVAEDDEDDDEDDTPERQSDGQDDGDESLIVLVFDDLVIEGRVRGGVRACPRRGVQS